MTLGFYGESRGDNVMSIRAAMKMNAVETAVMNNPARRALQRQYASDAGPAARRSVACWRSAVGDPEVERPNGRG